MSTKIEQIKALREMTGVSMSLCKDVLEKSGYDQGNALLLLRELGSIGAQAKRERKLSEGRVGSYIHGEGRIGVLLQVDCETDFVARSDDFKDFMHEVMLQIAALDPQYVDRNSIPSDVVERERAALLSKAVISGKPESMLSKIVDGQMEKLYSQICLIDQQWVKDQSKKIGTLLTDLVQKTGENIVISRFSRFGAGMSK
jgi:elongation factor Ts